MSTRFRRPISRYFVILATRRGIKAANVLIKTKTVKLSDCTIWHETYMETAIRRERVARNIVCEDDQLFFSFLSGNGGNSGRRRENVGRIKSRFLPPTRIHFAFCRLRMLLPTSDRPLLRAVRSAHAATRRDPIHQIFSFFFRFVLVRFSAGLTESRTSRKGLHFPCWFG